MFILIVYFYIYLKLKARKQLPWDVDLDVDVSKEQWDSVTKYVIPALQKKLKLSSGQNSFLKQDI